MDNVLVISPHPDDETLGCGGSLYRHQIEGDSLFWLIVTGLRKEEGWPEEQVKQRNDEIRKVSEAYQFEEVFNLDYPTTKLDIYPLSDLIEKIGETIKNVAPEVVYMPFAQDVHSDHQIIARSVQSSIKWFRLPSIKKVLMYETLSETDINFIEFRRFRPNVYVNISKYLDGKIETMKIYSSELGEHPFPRNAKTLRALATLRGSQSGYEAAEAFQLVYERK